MKSLSVSIQMKATEQYFPVMLFIMLYKVVPTFESVDDIRKCGTSIQIKAIEQYLHVCGAVYYAVSPNLQRGTVTVVLNVFRF